eukprot:m51a1_g8392 hypothetical protein (380) ;mRNA; r:212123-213262
MARRYTVVVLGDGDTAAVASELAQHAPSLSVVSDASALPAAHVAVVACAAPAASPAALLLLGRLSAARPSVLVHLHAAPGAQPAPCGCLPGACCSTAAGCAALCAGVCARNAGGLDERPGTYGSWHLRPRSCDAAYLSSALADALREHRDGAVYVWAPARGGGVDYVAAATALGLRTWAATQKYLVLYRWNAGDGSADRVPAAATSVSGAVAAVLSPGARRVLLVLEERVNDPARPATFDAARAAGAAERVWRFPAGATDAGESDAEAMSRELREELGLEVPEAALRPVLHSNIRRARRWGVWDESDADAEPLLVNDHFTVFVAFVEPEGLRLKLQAEEIIEARWFDVQDVIAGRAGVHSRYANRLRDVMAVVERDGLC